MTRLPCPFDGTEMEEWCGYPDGDWQGLECPNCDYEEIYYAGDGSVRVVSESRGVDAETHHADLRGTNRLDAAVYRAGGKPRWMAWKYYTEPWDNDAWAEPDCESEEIPF